MEIFGLDCLITKATQKTKTSDTSRFNFDQQQEKDIGIWCSGYADKWSFTSLYNSTAKSSKIVLL